MIWFNLLTTVLKIVSALIDWGRERKLMNAGRNEVKEEIKHEIAERKEVADKIDAIDPDSIPDDFLQPHKRKTTTE